MRSRFLLGDTDARVRCGAVVRPMTISSSLAEATGVIPPGPGPGPGHIPTDTLCGDSSGVSAPLKEYAGESVNGPPDGTAGVCGACCWCTRERTRASSSWMRSLMLAEPFRCGPGV